MDNLPVYDVADVLKLYFHELPDCLLTERLSETCCSVFTRTTPVLAPVSHYAVQTTALCSSTNISCWRKAAVVSRKVADGLSFDCGQCSSFAVFAVYLRFPVVHCGCRTGRLEPHKWESDINATVCKFFQRCLSSCLPLWLTDNISIMQIALH